MQGRSCSHRGTPLLTSEGVRLESNYFFANTGRCEKLFYKKSIDTEMWIHKWIFQNLHLTSQSFVCVLQGLSFTFSTNTIPIQSIFAFHHVLLFTSKSSSRETEFPYPALVQHSRKQDESKKIK